MAVYDAFVQEVQTAGLGDKVEVSIIGCHGLCSMSPVVVLSDDTLYGHLKPKDVAKVVEEHLKGGQPVERFLYKDAQTGERIRDWKDIGFYKLQTRIALRDVGVINPETIDAYVAVGGYEAARMALTEKTPEWIIEEVTDSGIRGRGGAGFPTGVKWKFANQSKSDEKYLICNADEGDPGAFMDRSILEGDPHAVIEGMIIGAYAIGAHEGYVYVRAEYPLAVKRLTMAVAAGRGARLPGQGHPRHGLGVRRAPQARAPARSSAARRRRSSPPSRASAACRARGRRSPRSSGLWGKPTNINNVETFANIPWIIKNGAEAYSALGTETSRGTKAFASPARSPTAAWSRCPWAPRLRHLIFDVGGGMQGRQAVQGRAARRPLGRLPAGAACSTRRSTTRASPRPAPSSAPAAWSWSTTTPAWSTSRASSSTSPRRSRAASASPAASAPSACSRSSTASSRATAARATSNCSRRWADYIIDGTLCALGGTAPNPVLTTIKYFRDEYEAHIHEKRCPAGKCKSLITYYIDAEACTGCMLCAKKCPTSCITGERKQPHVIDVANCIKCDTCRQVCKFDAVKVRSGIEQAVAGAAQGAES